MHSLAVHSLVWCYLGLAGLLELPKLFDRKPVMSFLFIVAQCRRNCSAKAALSEMRSDVIATSRCSRNDLFSAYKDCRAAVASDENALLQLHSCRLS